jgi:hypothetical protein
MDMASPIKKGTAFEVQISSVLSSLKNKGCFMLPNLRIHSSFLKTTTEIDRLFITPWNIYCIEAKSFNSELQGRLSDVDWYGRSGTFTTKIFNPVTQNFEHIRSLNNNLRRANKKALEMTNVVVVPDSCNINTDVELVYNFSSFIDSVVSDSFKGVRLNVQEVIDSISAVKVG